MPTLIPRFEATQPIEPGPIAPAGSLFNTLANAFQSIATKGGEAFVATREQEAAMQGEKAGEATNFQPASNITAAGRAFNKAALEANKYTVGADILNRSNDLLREFGSNIAGPENTAAYRQTFNAYGTELLSAIPEENRQYARNILLNQGIKGVNVIQNKVGAQQNAQAFAKFNQGYQTYFNTMSNEAQNGNRDAAGVYLGRILDAANGLEANGTMDPKAAERYRQLATTEFHMQDAIGQYRASGDKATFIKNFMKSDQWNRVLSADQKEQAMRKMLSLQKLQNNTEGLNKNVLAQKRANYLFQLQNGVPRDPQTESQLVNADPQKEDQLNTQFQINAKQGSLFNSFKTSTLPELQLAISELKQPLTGKALKSPTALLQEKSREALGTQLQNLATQLNKNPIQTLENSPDFAQADQKLKTTMVTLPANPANPDYQTQLSNYNQARDKLILNYQRARGIPEDSQQVIPTQEAANFGAQFSSATSTQKLQLAQQIQNRYGQNSSIAFKQIAAKGAPLEGPMLLAMLNNPQSRSLLPDALNAFSQKTSDLQKAVVPTVSPPKLLKTVKNNLQPYLDSIANYNGPTTPVINSVVDATNRLALFLCSKPGANEASCASQAANALVLNHYNFDSINGHSYRIPKEINNQPISQTQVTKANQSIISEFLLKNVKNIRTPTYWDTEFGALTPQQRRTEYISQALLTGYFTTDKDDQGMTFVDTNGVPVKTVDGQKIQYKFSDLTDQNSMINQLMASQKPKVAKELTISGQLRTILGPSQSQLFLDPADRIFTNGG